MSPSEIKILHADSFVEELVSWKKYLNLTVTTVVTVRLLLQSNTVTTIVTVRFKNMNWYFPSSCYNKYNQGGGPFVARCRLDKLIRC